MKSIRNKRARAEERKKQYMIRKGYHLPVTPERATLYLIKKSNFSNQLYHNIPNKIELKNQTCTMVIGRSSKTSDITLDAPNMPGLISRSHARIHIKRHFVTGTLLIHVEDMESTNGTFINGSEIYPLDVVSDSESENEPATYFSDDEEFTSDKKENEKKNEKALEEEEESEEDSDEEVAMDPESRKAQIVEFKGTFEKALKISVFWIQPSPDCNYFIIPRYFFYSFSFFLLIFFSVTISFKMNRNCMY